MDALKTQNLKVSGMSKLKRLYDPQIRVFKFDFVPIAGHHPKIYK